MHFLIVLLTLTSLQIQTVMQATCDKTSNQQLSLPTIHTPATEQTFRGPRISNGYGNNSSDGQNQEAASTTTTTGYSNESQPTTTTSTLIEDETIALNDLDALRLEYNKYKILSHLGITDNPDELSPALNHDLRLQLTSSTAFKESQRKDETRNLRHKRSLACNEVKSNKDACCLESFYLNFTEIGWDKWILYPNGYHANYCRGQCDLSHARYYHSTLLSKFSNVIGLCCSPKQMAPLRLLYIDEENKVLQKSIPDMIVESCDCA